MQTLCRACRRHGVGESCRDVLRHSANASTLERCMRGVQIDVDTTEDLMSFQFRRTEPPRHDWRRAHERLDLVERRRSDLHATLYAAATTAIACAALLASAALA